ncbi:MAG: hypothetical protein OHK006_06060 [Thermodesulfovibrionales bacterium]
MRNRALRILSSWWLLAGLVLVTAVTYLTFSQNSNPYPAWLSFLLGSAPGLVIVTGFAANILALSIRIVLQAVRPGPATPGMIRAMDAFLEVSREDGGSIARIEDWSRERGFSVHREESSLRAVKAAASFLPGTVLRAGILISLVSALVSFHVRKTSQAVLHEQEHASFFGQEIVLSRLSAPLPEDFLQVSEAEPVSISGLYADISADGASARIGPGFARNLKGTWYRIVHLNYAQEVVITDNGKTRQQVWDLGLLPPGAEDTVRLPGGPDVSVSLSPDRTISKGLLTGKQFNLRAPRYRMVFRTSGQQDSADEHILVPGAAASVGTTTLRLGRSGLAVTVQAVRDPALPFLYAGVLLCLAGCALMPSRFFWYRRELAAAEDAGGRIVVGYREEFFRKWGIMKFHTQFGKDIT